MFLLYVCINRVTLTALGIHQRDQERDRDGYYIDVGQRCDARNILK
jgi:hypothetical protein